MSLLKNITVYCIVYNEERRIEKFLKIFRWCSDLVIFDKSSTDRTQKICMEYTDRVITIPYQDTGLGPTKNILSLAKNEWIMHVSCSDIIHPNLVKKILDLINVDNFAFDVIAFPYQVGVLGIISKHSPWSSFPLKEYLFKKNAVVFSEEVHKEISFKPGSKIYKMKKDKYEAVFHLTHENLNTFFERHIRYTKAEINRGKYKKFGLLKISGEIIAAILWMIFYKRVWMLGRNGFALFLAFLSYFFMKFLFLWESKNNIHKNSYSNIKENILSEWKNTDLTSSK
ncbi:MAG: glycosyltransferase [bacterium]|nr:glycosyltransferase [bacterium]